MGLLPQFRGCGTKLINAALRGARELGFIRIELTVRADSTPAIRLHEKVGFKTEGVMQDAVSIDGQFKDVILMAKIDR